MDMSSRVSAGRRESGQRESPAEAASRRIQPPDLRQVAVLSKGEWQRIQDELKRLDEDKESLIEAERRREALHMESKEVVKRWSNTIAGQRQKKLEAKTIREEMEEENRRAIDKEEAEYREQRRREAIEKAKTQLFYQTDRVKGLHRALMLTETLKEREAQIELKNRIQKASKDVSDNVLGTVKAREDEAQRREKEQSLQRKLRSHAVAEELKQQIKDNELARELRQKLELKEDVEEIEHQLALHQREQKMEEENQAQMKNNLVQTHLENISNNNLMRAIDAQKQKAEEEQRKLFLSAKQKMVKLQKDKEKELFRNAQLHRERIMNQLAVEQEDQSEREEQRIALAVAEQEAKQARQQTEQEEKKAAMMESIAAHTELMRREKRQKDKAAKEETMNSLQAKKEADRIFSEKQQVKEQKRKENGKNVQDSNAGQIARKTARQQQLRQEERELEMKNAELLAEEENQFHQYSQQMISAAAEAQRNVFPLCKAAGEGIGGGHGPVSGGVQPSYLVQDMTGAQMPKYVSATTQDIKTLHEAVDIQEAKMRLGFTWL